MTTIEDYETMDAMDMAEAVRAGIVTPENLLDAALARLEKTNPTLNAVVLTLKEKAREAAVKCPVDAPFAGVPFLLKDAGHALKGVPMSCGSALLKEVDPNYDAHVVERFERAGLIIFGKTNTPEFKLAYTTEPKAFGATRNPYDPECSSGGSSGGSAAAVAARIVPMASATDEGGSIRVPAAHCGQFGFKPGRGRTPIGPRMEESWDGLSHNHVITWSVRDSAAMLDVLAAGGSSENQENGRPVPSFLSAVSEPPGRLRIGFHAKPAFGRNVHPDCLAGLKQTCRLLVDLGHEVEEIDPGYSEDEVAFCWCVIMLKNMKKLVDGLMMTFGRDSVERNLELSTRTVYQIGKQLTEDTIQKAEDGRKTIEKRMKMLLEHRDVLLTPTLGMPPVKIGSHNTFIRRNKMALLSRDRSCRAVTGLFGLDKVLRLMVKDSMKDHMPYTMAANITGQPAMSVPLCRSGRGLPIGMQFMGREEEEKTLFRLAGQLEKAQPWKDRLPAL